MTGEKQPFIVHCGKCGHEWTFCYLPVSVGIFVKIAKNVCPTCGARKVFAGPQPKPTPEGDVLAWVSGGDTGVSSLTIWRALLDIPTPPGEWPDVPWDPADFGRCYRLLKIMPTWRARLPEVAAMHPNWKPFVDAWDELTALYEEELPKGTAPKLYARMQQLLERRHA